LLNSSKARTAAKALVTRLKDELHRQQFGIVIQAAVGGKILGKNELHRQQFGIIIQAAVGGKILGKNVRYPYSVLLSRLSVPVRSSTLYLDQIPIDPGLNLQQIQRYRYSER